MTKAQLITAMAARAGLTKKAAEKALEAMVESVQMSLKQGDRVSLVGFGTFAVARRAPRQGRNPRTGAPVRIPARKVPVFRAGKGLRDVV